MLCKCIYLRLNNKHVNINLYLWFKSIEIDVPYIDLCYNVWILRKKEIVATIYRT